jgi:hypothetical protein
MLESTPCQQTKSNSLGGGEGNHRNNRRSMSVSRVSYIYTQYTYINQIVFKA